HGAEGGPGRARDETPSGDLVLSHAVLPEDLVGQEFGSFGTARGTRAGHSGAADDCTEISGRSRPRVSCSSGPRSGSAGRGSGPRSDSDPARPTDRRQEPAPTADRTGRPMLASIRIRSRRQTLIANLGPLPLCDRVLAILEALPDFGHGVRTPVF